MRRVTASLACLVGLAVTANVSADVPENPRGPVEGGKTYTGMIGETSTFDEPRSYAFRVRRRAKVSVTITNTTRDILGDGQVFDVDFLNRRGDVITFPSLEGVFPDNTDTLSKRLKRGKYYLAIEPNYDPVRFAFKLTPKYAIKPVR